MKIKSFENNQLISYDIASEQQMHQLAVKLKEDYKTLNRVPVNEDSLMFKRYVIFCDEIDSLVNKFMEEEKIKCTTT